MRAHEVALGRQVAAADDDSLRTYLKGRLALLETEVEPRAYSHEEVLAVVSRLQELEPNAYDEKLVIAGFTLEPYGIGDDAQACETCMYYKVHRKFCELPELMLPVEAEWSCRLWRM